MRKNGVKRITLWINGKRNRRRSVLSDMENIPVIELKPKQRKW